MMQTRCKRRWQAEAAIDGRLAPADVASFERHRASCESCTKEARALAMLERAAQNLPVLNSTPLTRRRLRHELLERANAALLRPRRWPYVRALFAVVTAVAFIIGIALWHQVPETPSGDAAASRAPTFELRAAPGARWSTVEQGPTLRLSTRSGRFELSVDKLEPGQRFLLELPDGELEVQGTQFLVDVDGERTQRVHVTEGRVELRLRNQEPRLLQAGELWSAPKSPSPSDADAGPAPPVDARPKRTEAASPPGGAPRVRETHRQMALPKHPRSPVDSPHESRPSAGEAFARATSAFVSGDYGKAERLFVEYERAHPGDSRVEDATFLRVVARLRRGDQDGARRLAQDYLDRYPTGLRRSEVEQLVK